MAKIGKRLTDILLKKEKSAPQMYDIGDPKPVDSAESIPASLLSVDQLIPNTLQPRKVFDEEKLQELADSIEKNGLIQPVVYRKTDKGNEIIAGERRWRASKMANLPEIPVIELKATDEEALGLAIIENVQRDDLNPIEKGLGFKTLIEQFELTQQEVAEQLGLSRTSVTNLMRLLQLPDKVKDNVSRETLSMGHARCLLSLKTPEAQIALANRIVREGLSVRQTEGIVYGEPAKSGKSKKAKEPSRKDQNILNLEIKLKQLLGTKVEIQNSKKNKGKIIIHYYSNDDFLRISDQIGLNKDV